MKLTVVIPFFNGHTTIGKLLQDLGDIPIIIVDDLSSTSYAPYQPNIRTIRLEQKGYFAGAVNRGLVECNTDVLVLNQDARLQGNTWKKVIDQYRAEYAMIGERIHGDHPAHPSGYIQGTFMWLRQDLIEKVGLLNERDYPLWGCTCEYQVRASRAGYNVLPLMRIAGFSHYRKGKFGDGIQKILRQEPARRELFIRTPPEVSIIVPCYNYGKYLPDLLASLLGGDSSMGIRKPQTFQSFEVIIVDDASTDDSWKVIQGMKNSWKGIHTIRRRKNGGTAATLNTGIAESHGKYITILSADDMREDWSIEELYRAQVKNPHSLIYDNVVAFANGAYNDEMRIGVSEYDFEKLLYKNHIHAGIMFPKRAWDTVGGYPELFGQGREDWAMNVTLGIHGYCGVYINKRGYMYRREGHNRSLTNGGPKNREMYIAKLMAMYPNVYKGERPMGCCGGKSKSIPKGVNVNKRMQVAMDSGGVVLEYIGGSYGTQTFYGPATGSQYLAGITKPLVICDPKDALTGSIRKPGLLEQMEHGKPVFRKYVPPKQPVITIADATKEAKVTVTEEPEIAYSTQDGTIWNVEEPEEAKIEAGMDPTAELVSVEVVKATPRPKRKAVVKPASKPVGETAKPKRKKKEVKDV